MYIETIGFLQFNSGCVQQFASASRRLRRQCSPRSARAEGFGFFPLLSSNCKTIIIWQAIALKSWDFGARELLHVVPVILQQISWRSSAVWCHPLAGKTEVSLRRAPHLRHARIVRLCLKRPILCKLSKWRLGSTMQTARCQVPPGASVGASHL